MWCRLVLGCARTRTTMAPVDFLTCARRLRVSAGSCCYVPAVFGESREKEGEKTNMVFSTTQNQEPLQPDTANGLRHAVCPRWVSEINLRRGLKMGPVVAPAWDLRGDPKPILLLLSSHLLLPVHISLSLSRPPSRPPLKIVTFL